MRVLRRTLQVVTLVATLVVGVVALSLIVSQTPWFKDWIRRYIVRESKQYLNGELSIGHLGGNLFYGVQLSDVALDVSGERVVAVKGVELDYSVFTLISTGIVLDQIKLHQPALKIEQRSRRLEPGTPGQEAGEGSGSRRTQAAGVAAVHRDHRCGRVDSRCRRHIRR